MVSQYAVVEHFDIFLTHGQGIRWSLFTYHIEALVPSSSGAANASRTPQKFSGDKDVQFFTVGNLGRRTLVVYMKNLDSVFRVLEPVIGKIKRRRSTFDEVEIRSTVSTVGLDFFFPSDSYGLLLPKPRIVILCSKGFEIMDLSDFKSVIIPQKEDPRSEKPAKRCESCRPMEFGLYIGKRGDPSRRTDTIEWEETVEWVVRHGTCRTSSSSTAESSKSDT
ncbi:hypothetical protein BDM02DRAFT_3192640 [Thelephora ganbajun]|uniref:Uncharacterized protein n=1 Tax=Thelephora ganbajun TaxID=370292 RepID=A0ACB6YZY6_THEGA|nr:hypothetical protein BDM02DRAFT_3192640 [Thelephora ganbajun]